jgi:hypothetical protein
MMRTFGRREFLKTGAGAGLTLAMAKALAAGSGTKPLTKPSVVGVGIGEDYARATAKAVGLLGSFKTFVPKGSRVALLPNVQSRHPGSFTKPEILRAVIGLCKKAGAKEINCLSWQTVKQFEDTGLKAVIDAEGIGLKLFEKDESLFKPVPIPKGVALKEARLLAALDDHDRLINMPITKDHAGNKFTGTMKNLMGLNSPANNRTFHKPNWKTDPDDTAHLEGAQAGPQRRRRDRDPRQQRPVRPGPADAAGKGDRGHGPRRHRCLLRRPVGPEARRDRPDQAGLGAGPRRDRPDQGRSQGGILLLGEATSLIKGRGSAVSPSRRR